MNVPQNTSENYDIDQLLFRGEAKRISDAVSSPRDNVGARTALLTQLVNEERAEVSGADVVLQPDAAAQLTEGEKRLLDLPEPYPFGLEISISGILTDADHQYHYHFINGNQKVFSRVDKNGPIVSCDGLGPYMLDGRSYELVEAIDRHVNLSRGDMRENFLYFSRIKELSAETGTLLDPYLENEEVIAADRLTIRLNRGEDGRLEVEPVFGTEAESDPVNADAAFLRSFDSLGARPVYSTPAGRMVVTEAQERGLGQIKQVRHLSAEDEVDFLRAPQTFLDPDVIDLDSFSDRVIEIGEHQYKAFPFLRESKDPWLPPEGGLIIDGEVVPIPVDESDALLAAITVAIEEGHKSVDWHGRKIPIGPEVIGALEDLVGQLRGEPNSDPGNDDTPSECDTRVLRIVDNFEDAEYSSVRISRDPRSIHGEPRSLQAGTQLFAHQKTGVAWLQTRWHQGAKGVIVADDMGLGKTLLALSFSAWCAELMDDGLLIRRPVLIVAPVSLLENWQAEYEKRLVPVFGSPLVLYGKGIRELTSQDGVLDTDAIVASGLVLTTYETLRRHQLSLGKIEWAVAILDEAQKVKTPTAMVTTAAKAMKYDFGIAMTGTPVENSWVDLWSLMDFAQPGHLDGLKSFVSKYQTPLSRPETDRRELGEELQERVEQYMLRRLKKDHIEGLPSKTIKSHAREMPPVQLRSYVNSVTRAKAELAADDKAGSSVLKLIAQLRDISLCPLLGIRDDFGLAETPSQEIVDSSARLQVTFDVLDKRRTLGEKAIVFLISKRLQRVVQRVIRERYQIHAHIINGDVSGPKRQQLVDAFQTSAGFGVIILSTEAAGVGLNITEANHVIHLSRVWNPAKEDQATDRVYRIGQKKPVQVHIPMAVSRKLTDNGWMPFDEKLDTILEEKRELSRSVLLPSALEEGEIASFARDLFMGVDILSEAAATSTDSTREDWVDHLSPEAFEDLIALLYRSMGYQATRTPRSRDHGADVVAVPHASGGSGVLLQCKHTIHPHQPGPSGAILEVVSALTHYGREYSTNFTPAVVTNAVNLGVRGEQLASESGVQLIARQALLEMLAEHGVTEFDLSVQESDEPMKIETQGA